MIKNMEVKLDDGTAQLMGDGVVVVCQRDEHKAAQSVVLTQADLEVLRAALAG